MQSVEEVKDINSSIDVEYEDVSKIERIAELYSECEENLSEDDKNNYNRIINAKESASYDKLIEFLKSKSVKQ